MKRIVILGSAGSGKSTLARRVSEITGIEVLHLDTLFWKPGWVQVNKEDFERDVDAYIQKDSWITDGNYRGTLDKRLSSADTIIFIDVPRIVCLYRSIKRSIKYRGKSRPDLTEGCNEKFDWEFYKWIWNYPARNKPEILEKIQMNSQGKEVYYLKSKEDVENFINGIKQRSS